MRGQSVVVEILLLLVVVVLMLSFSFGKGTFEFQKAVSLSLESRVSDGLLFSALNHRVFGTAVSDKIIINFCYGLDKDFVQELSGFLNISAGELGKAYVFSAGDTLLFNKQESACLKEIVLSEISLALPCGGEQKVYLGMWPITKQVRKKC